MKPETERLLQQCRGALLQYSNEELDALFASWLEYMVGEESMEENLDDLCLLLGYGVRSTRSQTMYATYTAWWDVEGYADPDGEFVCLDVTALQQHLIMMSVKQLHLVTELAYQVCTQDAEAESQPHPPLGQDWLRALAAWLNTGAQEPFYKQAPITTPPAPQQQLSRKQLKAQQKRLDNELKAQQRKIDNELVEQVRQCGYVNLSSDIIISNQAASLIWNRCKKERRPYIDVEDTDAQFATITINLMPIREALRDVGRIFPGAPELSFLPQEEIAQQRLQSLSELHCVKIETEPQAALLVFPNPYILKLTHVPTADVPAAIQDFMALWPEIQAHYETQLEASRAAHLMRERELEEARTPAWHKALARLQAPGVDCPELPDTVTLPEGWPSLLSKEQLGAFLTFLKLPASSREIKPNLVQHLASHLQTNKMALAQFFEVFAHEFSVPPWELEKLLDCTKTERKRWTEEKKLPVLTNSSFHKASSDYEYPLYDRRVILSLTPEEIGQWRDEHQAIVRERRKTAAQAAAAARKARQQETQVAPIVNHEIMKVESVESV